MASYDDGTIFDSSQTFQDGTTFGSGCVFAPGCIFNNSCIFGDGCVFGDSCKLLKTDTTKEPHRTGTGCVFGAGCGVDYTEVGDENVFKSPNPYNPVSEGSGVVREDSETHVEGQGTQSIDCLTYGQAVFNNSSVTLCEGVDVRVQ